MSDGNSQINASSWTVATNASVTFLKVHEQNTSDFQPVSVCRPQSSAHSPLICRHAHANTTAISRANISDNSSSYTSGSRRKSVKNQDCVSRVLVLLLIEALMASNMSQHYMLQTCSAALRIKCPHHLNEHLIKREISRILAYGLVCDILKISRKYAKSRARMAA